MYRHINENELKIDKTLGYVYFIEKSHPLANKGTGRVYYHRHVASIGIGYWLPSKEHVHHIDDNKLNNNLSNLQVCSASEHGKEHTKHLVKEKFDLECPVCKSLFKVLLSAIDKRVCCSEKCLREYTYVWKVSKEELEFLIWNYSYTQIAKMYPISDVGAKKKAKSLGCKIPPPYFFSKTEVFRQEQRKLNNISDLSSQQSSKLLA